MALKFRRAKQPPPAAFAMADHEEPALKPPPAAAPANPAAPAPVVEPLDVPAPVAEPEVIFVVALSLLLCAG